jgi:hypothetical protein
MSLVTGHYGRIGMQRRAERLGGGGVHVKSGLLACISRTSLLCRFSLWSTALSEQTSSPALRCCVCQALLEPCTGLKPGAGAMSSVICAPSSVAEGQAPDSSSIAQASSCQEPWLQLLRDLHCMIHTLIQESDTHSSFASPSAS